MLLARFLVFALAAMLWGSFGCSRELQLPEPPTRPSVTAVAPRRAFAGQLMTISGTGFEDDPSSNVIVFPRASARAHERKAGSLLVRVPLDAGSGAIGVTNARGSSQPVAGFEYLGAGQLGRGEIVSETPLVHNPRRLFALDGALYLDSRLSSAVLRVDDAGFFAPGGARIPPTTGGGAVYSVDLDHVVYRVDAATRAVLKRPFPHGTFDHIVHLSRGSGNVLVGLGPHAADPNRLAVTLLDPITLEDKGLPAQIPPYVSSQPVDAGGGQLVLAVLSSPAATAVEVAILDLSGSAPVYTLLANGPHQVDTESVALAAGVSSSGGGRLAAVGLKSGNIGLIDLDAPAPAFLSAEIGTFSPSTVEGLVLTGDGQLIVAKPADDVVLGVDLATRTPTWSVQGRQPTQLAMLGGKVYVANAADNAVLVLDPAQKRQVGALHTDVRPGTLDGVQGISFLPGPSDPNLAQFIPDSLFVVTEHPTALLQYGLGFLPPIVTPSPFVPSLTAYDPFNEVVWVAGPAQVGVASTTDIYPIPGKPQRLAFASGSLAVAHDRGVSLVQTGKVGSPHWNGPHVDASAYYSLGFLPSGEVYAGARLGNRDAILTWTLDALKSADPTLRGTYVSDQAGGGSLEVAVVLEEGLWAFFVDSDATSWAALLDAKLDVVRAVKYAPQISNLTPSPNARTLLHWEKGFRGGSDLHIRSADPDTTFKETGFVHLQGTVSGFTFDARGERLFVLTRDPDSLLVME